MSDYAAQQGQAEAAQQLADNKIAESRGVFRAYYARAQAQAAAARDSALKAAELSLSVGSTQDQAEASGLLLVTQAAAEFALPEPSTLRRPTSSSGQKQSGLSSKVLALWRRPPASPPRLMKH
ncbi:hypothetical protein [Methylocella sp.]|jgi:hypothetical protein|uniref:hypothetical protein n=1 Tax=Methylocella sp. TaxID=1978226 RepID=UPI003C2517D6